MKPKNNKNNKNLNPLDHLTFYQQEKILEYCDFNEVEANKILKENPYQLLDIAGFGWITVDERIAKKIGFNRQSKHRLMAALKVVADEITYNDGNIWMKQETFVKKVMNLCKGFKKQEIIDAIQESNDLFVKDNKIYSRKLKFFEEKISEFVLSKKG